MTTIGIIGAGHIGSKLRTREYLTEAEVEQLIWVLGVPFLTLRTCRVAVPNST